jgi:hypothetical protein
MEAALLLGDLIARFKDEAVVSETLIGLGDLALVTRVSGAAAADGLSLGEFAMRAVQQFVAQATDDDWLTLMGRMARSDDPGGRFLRDALARALPREQAVVT